MDQKVLNLLARASAEFNALGDDDHSGMIMGAVEWLVAAHGLPQETFDQANELYISLRDLSITDIPDNGWPEEAENCVAVMLEGSKN